MASNSTAAPFAAAQIPSAPASLGAKAVDRQRLAKYSEEWRQLLREASAAASAASPPRKPPQQRSPEASSAAAPGSSSAPGTRVSSPAVDTHPQGAPAAPQHSEGGASSVVNSLLESLDRFFADQKNCEAADEASASNGHLRHTDGDDEARNGGPPPQKFRVQVPKQYPGVQYRRSKNLEDRYLRYAKLGTLVSGHLEDDGEWLRISDKVYLPVKVGGTKILELVSNQGASGAGSSRKSLWWACSHGNQGEEEEVVNDLDEELLNKAN